MKCALIIMDGFGIAPKSKGNAITTAKKPNLDRLLKNYTNTTLEASGLAVGLPAGQMGNSEVGHLNIGAGRVVYQDITAIDKSINDGDFFTNPAFLGAIKTVQKNKSTLHLMGLVSDGGVHSHINHLFALLELCKREKVQNVLIHVITDGRDTAPKSALKYIEMLEKKCAELGVGKVATVGGRYYGMDRDNRTERVQAHFDAIMLGKGANYATTRSVIDESYKNGVTDEFIVPCVVGAFKGVKDTDAFVFFNFRADRARQITQKISTERSKLNFVCMTEYDEKIGGVKIAFPPKNIVNTLAETLSKNGLSQVHLAETEKYAHVTFFFDGGVEKDIKGESKILVPSPKVATYDLQPEMSANIVRDKALALITAGGTDVLIMNFANCDMVGHTGNLHATVRAVETVDACVGAVVDAVIKSGGVALVTADHGNAEQMIAGDGTPFTAHTTNPVPFIICGKQFPASKKISKGALCDIAPTMLEILGIQKPAEMSGKSLL